MRAMFVSHKVKAVLETTGPKDTTQKVLNSLIQFSMSFEKKLKAAIVFKAFSSLTRWVVELALVWEPFSFPRSEKNTPTES